MSMSRQVVSLAADTTEGTPAGQTPCWCPKGPWHEGQRSDTTFTQRQRHNSLETREERHGMEGVGLGMLPTCSTPNAARGLFVPGVAQRVDFLREAVQLLADGIVPAGSGSLVGRVYAICVHDRCAQCLRGGHGNVLDVVVLTQVGAGGSGVDRTPHEGQEKVAGKLRWHVCFKIMLHELQETLIVHGLQNETKLNQFYYGKAFRVQWQEDKLTSSGLYLDRQPSPWNSSKTSFNFLLESAKRSETDK